MTTVLAGQHRRPTQPGRVPTDRGTAHCWCNLGHGCPRHQPKSYAINYARHRSDRP